MSAGRLLTSNGTPQYREQESGASADQTEHGAFGQQLTDDAAAARAERVADRDLALTRAGAREQQIGDVGAGDKSTKPTAPSITRETRADVADDFVLERDHFSALAPRVRKHPQRVRLAKLLARARFRPARERPSRGGEPREDTALTAAPQPGGRTDWTRTGIQTCVSTEGNANVSRMTPTMSAERLAVDQDFAADDV